MGMIRKALMISTAGAVRGSSKKQRVAKKTLKETRAQTKLAKAQYKQERKGKECR